jgi:glycosyltransferase involved in cell wall biosynthesis
MFRNSEEEITLDNPRLPVRYFPLQRGFAKFPMNLIAGEADRLIRRLLRRTENADASPLVCCSPHYAAVAERWSGPVIYYATDLFVAWGEDPRRIKSFEQRMCKVADLVCPDSQRIADHLIAETQCAKDKIRISPMATRSANLLSHPNQSPFDLPEDISDMDPPFAGVIGNLATNMDWELLQQVIRRTPWLSWVFVGPIAMPVPDPRQGRARQSLIEHGGRVRFVGEKPYGSLRDYARVLHLAILPYRKQEPTYSGSATKFYEHLAACRPILATRGVEELLHKEPLLKLVDTAEEMATELERLREAGFRDGHEELRWRESREETWERRAGEMLTALGRSFGCGAGLPQLSRDAFS